MKVLVLATLCLVVATDARLAAVAQRVARGAQTPRRLPSSVHFDTGASALHLPFVLSNNLALIQARVNGSAPLWFIFDTGASATVIDAGVARRLGLRARGTTVGNGAAGKATATRLDAATISFRGVEVRDLTLYALPLDSFGPVFGRSIGGIVGNDIIGKLAVEIDYAQGLINFFDPAGYDYKGAGASMPVTIEEEMIFVRGEIEAAGAPPLACKFEIDTGSTGATLLNTPFVNKNQLLSSISAAKRINIGGVGGTGAAILGRLRAVRFADFSLANVVARFSQATRGDYASAKYDALLGGEIFRRFKLVVDLQRRRVIFEPNAHLSEPFEVDMSGIELIGDGVDFTTYLVDDVTEGSPAAEAGVRGGDVLAAIDGRRARTLTLDEIRAMFREGGRSYSLTLNRKGKTVETKMKLKRLI